MSALGVKRTLRLHCEMSAFDPKRTLACDGFDACQGSRSVSARPQALACFCDLSQSGHRVSVRVLQCDYRRGGDNDKTYP
jgi:hypothetical protein